MNICPFGIASNLSGIMTFTVYSADTATEYKVEPSMSEILPGSTEEHILSLVETGISLNFLVFNCIFWQIIGLLLYYVLTKFIKHYVGSTLESFKGPEIFFILGLQSCILMKLSLTSMELSANSLPKKEFVDLLPAFCSYKLSFND